MPADTPPASFTVDLEQVDLPHLDLGGASADATQPADATLPADDTQPAPRKKKGRHERGRSTKANHGLRGAPQAKRYAFRRS
jgi:hypothetical protein